MTYCAVFGLLQTAILLLISVLFRCVLPLAYSSILHGHTESIPPFSRFVLTVAGPWGFLVPLLMLSFLLICVSRKVQESLLLHVLGVMSLVFSGLLLVILIGGIYPLTQCYSIME